MAKVCVLTSVHTSFDVRIFYKECKSLEQAGFEVTLIVPHDRDEVRDGVRIKAVPKPSGGVTRMLCTAWQLFREAVRLNADLYHFHDPELIPVGLLLLARGKIVVYDIHEDVPATILSKHYLHHGVRHPLAWVIGRIEELSCRWFSALVAATPAIAQRFNTLNANTVVVQNFPLLNEFARVDEEAFSQRACSVVYVGVIAEERGIRQMVEAMSLIPDSLHVTVKLAGIFSPAYLRDVVVRLPGWKQVEELGFLDRAGVAQVLRQVRAGLIVIHPEPRYQVAYPVKMFEYMSAGIPVIASDFPLWRQIIEGTGCGLLVDPMDPKAIAEAIEYLLTNPKEAEAMGHRAREAVNKHYNWVSEERKLLELYTSLV